MDIESKHFIHIGRCLGEGELNEVDADVMRQLGNWNIDTYQHVYSSKLPLKGLRAMAGFPQQKGRYWLPRAGVMPSSELQKRIFAFIDNPDLGNTPTLTAFKGLLKNLRVIFLQVAHY